MDFLGFKLDWGNRSTGALFMQVSLDECVVHLSEYSGDACPRAAVKLHTDNIEDYVKQLVAKNIHRESRNKIPESQSSLVAAWIWCLSIRSATGSFLLTQVVPSPRDCIIHPAASIILLNGTHFP